MHEYKGSEAVLNLNELGGSSLLISCNFSVVNRENLFIKQPKTIVFNSKNVLL